MISLKNDTVVKLINRLYDTITKQSSHPFYAHAVIQLTCLLLIKRRDSDLWDNLKQDYYSSKILDDKIKEEVYDIIKKIDDLYSIPADIEIKIDITDRQSLNECISIIDRIYEEIHDRKDRLVDTLSFYDIDGLIFDELLERSIYGFSSGQNLYLPRHICKVMANLIDIRITDYVYDPLCNNGSMLLSAFESAMINEYGTAKTILTDDDGFNAMPYALFVNNELQAPALLGKGTDCHQLYLPC